MNRPAMTEPRLFICQILIRAFNFANGDLLMMGLQWHDNRITDLKLADEAPKLSRPVAKEVIRTIRVG